MSLIRINHDPSRKDLNVFGAIWLVFFSVVAFLIWRRTGNHTVAALVFGVAVAVPLVGWILPRFMRCVYLGMTYASFPIGFTISFLLMVVIYYGIVFPLGLMMKICRYDPMTRKLDEAAPSYWIEHKQQKEVKTYFRQF